MADAARIERAQPFGVGGLASRCIASLPSVLEMAETKGIEPLTLSRLGRFSRPLRPMAPSFRIWCPSLDSNQQPSRSKRDASTNWATGAVWRFLVDVAHYGAGSSVNIARADSYWSMIGIDPLAMMYAPL